MLQPQRHRLLQNHNDKENASVTPYNSKTPARLHGLTTKGNPPNSVLNTKLKNIRTVPTSQPHHLHPAKTPSSGTSAQRSLLKDITNKTPAPITFGTTGKSKPSFSHVKPVGVTDLRKTLAAASLRDHMFTRKVEGARTSKVSFNLTKPDSKNLTAPLQTSDVQTSSTSITADATNKPVSLKAKKVYAPKVLPHDESAVEYMPPRQEEQPYYPDFNLDLSPLMTADPPRSDFYYFPHNAQNPHDGYRFTPEISKVLDNTKGSINATDLSTFNLPDLDVDDSILSNPINVPVFDDPFHL